MLIDAFIAYRSIQLKKDETAGLITTLRASIGVQSPAHDGMPHGSDISDKVGTLAVELADLSARLDYYEGELQLRKPEIDRLIRLIDDDLTRTACRLYYTRALTWDEAAAVLGGGNTSEGVRKRCTRAIDRLTYNKEENRPIGSVDVQTNA